jgi:hypothetical protein
MGIGRVRRILIPTCIELRHLEMKKTGHQGMQVRRDTLIGNELAADRALGRIWISWTRSRVRLCIGRIRRILVGWGCGCGALMMFRGLNEKVGCVDVIADIDRVVEV